MGKVLVNWKPITIIGPFELRLMYGVGVPNFVIVGLKKTNR